MDDAFGHTVRLLSFSGSHSPIFTASAFLLQCILLRGFSSLISPLNMSPERGMLKMSPLRIHARISTDRKPSLSSTQSHLPCWFWGQYSACSSFPLSGAGRRFDVHQSLNNGFLSGSSLEKDVKFGSKESSECQRAAVNSEETAWSNNRWDVKALNWEYSSKSVGNCYCYPELHCRALPYSP